MTIARATRRAVGKYTAQTCLEAYRLSEQGEGPSNIAHSFLALRSVAAANAAINAGRELSDLVGQRVEAGEGDGHDTGRVVAVIDAATVEVAWDSGVRTPCPIADLTLLAD